GNRRPDTAETERVLHSGQIPKELRRLRQWVAVRFEPNPSQPSKPAKVPYCDEQTRASHADPETWLSYRQARGLARAKGFAGIGFVFTDADPYVGVDLDGCRNPDSGEIAKWAKRIVKVLSSYTELSQSGTGLHIVVKGRLPSGIRHKFDRLIGMAGGKKAAIEVYERVRYFMMTGHVHEARRRIARSRSGLDWLIRRYLTPSVPGTTIDVPRHNLQMQDDEVIALAASINRSEFHRLFVAGETRAPKTQSESDYQLACMFVQVVGGDLERIERLMRRSALKREKWERHRSYLKRTIAAAINAAGLTSITPNHTEQRFFPSLRFVMDNPELMEKPTALVPLIAWRGRVTLLAGREKQAGKSTLLAAAAKAVAQAKQFLGADTCERPAPVLWISADEEHTADVATRFLPIGASRDRIALLYPSGSLSERLAELERTVEHTKPALVIIDTLSNFARVRDPFSSTEWPEILLRIKRLARTHDAAIVLVHHTAKNSPKEYRDSTSIGATVDQIVILSQIAGAPSRERELDSRGRMTGVEEVRIGWDGRTYSVVPSPAASLAHRVCQFLESHGPASQRAVETAIRGDRERLRRMLRDLVKGGTLVREKGARRAYMYSLV